MLCVLRTMMLAVFAHRDAYLLANCCAVLHNVAGRVASVHPYTAERVVKLLHQLCVRLVRANSGVSSTDSDNLVSTALTALGQFAHEVLR